METNYSSILSVSENEKPFQLHWIFELLPLRGTWVCALKHCQFTTVSRYAAVWVKLHGLAAYRSCRLLMQLTSLAHLEYILCHSLRYHFK